MAQSVCVCVSLPLQTVAKNDFERPFCDLLLFDIDHQLFFFINNCFH